MFPDEIDTSLLVKVEDRANHWLYPPTGDVFSAPDFKPVKAKTPVPPPVATQIPTPPAATPPVSA